MIVSDVYFADYHVEHILHRLGDAEFCFFKTLGHYSETNEENKDDEPESHEVLGKLSHHLLNHDHDVAKLLSSFQLHDGVDCENHDIDGEQKYGAIDARHVCRIVIRQIQGLKITFLNIHHSGAQIHDDRLLSKPRLGEE